MKNNVIYTLYTGITVKLDYFVEYMDEKEGN